MEQSDEATSSPLPVRIYLLGGFRVEREGRALPDDVWTRRSAKALVKVLALTTGHRLHREQVLDLLWPDLPPESAASALRKALHLARHALEPDLPPRGESTYLRLSDDVLVLDRVWIDVDQFRAAATAALVGGDLDQIVAALSRSGGEVLPEDRYEDWAASRRQELHELRLALLLAAAGAEEARGNHAAAADHLRQAIEFDPIREESHRRLMRCYALDGRRHDALRQYRMCREVVKREIDTEPEAETEALYQAILAAKVAPTPASPLGQRPRRALPSAARRLVSDALVGRHRERDHLVAALEEAAGGSGATILVGGEAGVGKSRLVAEVARLAHEHGAFVLWGGCYEPEGHLPYGPLVEALNGAVAGSPPEELSRLAAAFPELDGFLPAFPRAAVETGASGRLDANRTRLFAAVVRLLETLTADRPLVLVLDDLHAADPATLQLLHHLARMAGERAWLILGTYREEDVDAGGDFQRLCAVATREGLCRRLDLARLSPEACGEVIARALAGGEIPAALATMLYDRSLGNPLYLHELLRAMRERDEIVLLDGQWTVNEAAEIEVPQQIRALIAVRVDRLGGDVRRALALVATAGETAPFRLLREAGELPESRLLDALDLALDAQLLEERGDGYAFRHPLVRATLYERLSPPRRALLHASLARAIECFPEGWLRDQPELIESLARHWAAAGDPARAIPYLIKAADRAIQVYAVEDARMRLTRALALLDGLGDAPHDRADQRIAILERLAELHALAGENRLALARFLDAAAAAVVFPPARAALHRKAAQQALLAGDLAQAMDLLTTAEAQLGALGPTREGVVERARLLAVRAQHDFLVRRFPQALDAAEESLRLAEEAGSTVDVARACEMIAMACLPLGEWRRGMTFERRRAALADPMQAIHDVADVHICLADYNLYAEPPAEAARAVLRTLAESERAGAPRSLALCHYYLGTMAYMRGRFGEAISRITEAIDLYRRVDSGSGEAIALMVRGLAHTALGRVAEARQDFERAGEIAQHGSLRTHGLVRVLAGYGRHALELNDPVTARRLAEQGLAYTEEPGSCICFAGIYPVAAAAFGLTGDLERGAALGEQALAHATALGSPFFLCMAQQARGVVYALGAAWEGAFAALDAALTLAERSDFPYEQARTLMLQAFVRQMRSAPGDNEAAGELAVRAGQLLHGLGIGGQAA